MTAPDGVWMLGILEDTDRRERIVMMGQLGSGQDKLFYSFNLDNHVPRVHLLRGIDYFVDLRDLRQHLAPFCSPMGRPSIDPETMIRMLIVGYCLVSGPSAGDAKRHILTLRIDGSAAWFLTTPYRNIHIFEEPPRPLPRQ